eukprot:m51a1_g709 hypothetical protein (442) ;mRNA; f:404840-406290
MAVTAPITPETDVAVPKPPPELVGSGSRPPGRGRLVRCSASDLRCPWEGSERDQADHEGSCPYVALRPVLSTMSAQVTRLERELVAMRGRDSGAAAQAQAEALADFAAGAVPIECQAHRDLRETSLAGADLRGIVMTRRILRSSDLSGADLRDADLTAADLSECNLRGADLRWAVLKRAEMLGADITGAHLFGADLRGVDLSDRDLRGVDLRETDLRGASLRGSDLTGALLDGAKLDGVDNTDARFNAFPDSKLVQTAEESALLQRWVTEAEEAGTDAAGAPRAVYFCSRWDVSWRGTRDGFETSEFHRRCTGRGACIVLCTPTDKPNCVIGGYTSVGFRTGFQDRDKKAFVFQLRPTPIKVGTKDASLAVTCHAGSGPTFGRGLDRSHDLFVADCANIATTSFCKPTAAFDYSANGGRNLLGQFESRFSVAEVEVCTMNP